MPFSSSARKLTVLLKGMDNLTVLLNTKYINYGGRGGREGKYSGRHMMLPVSLSNSHEKLFFLMLSFISDVIIKCTQHVLTNLKCPLVQIQAVENPCF